MKIVASLILLLFASSCFASDFSERVEAGNKAADSPIGKSYERSLGPIIHGAIMGCVPPGSNGHLGNFTLVGDISALGSVLAVEVDPISETSACFAKQIQRATLPEPPFVPYPLTIEMNVAP